MKKQNKAEEAKQNKNRKIDYDERIGTVYLPIQTNDFRQ